MEIDLSRPRAEIEQECRARAQPVYIGEGIALGRVLGTYMMYVPAKDISLTPHLVLNGFWETWVTKAIASFVKPGDAVIDVGANVGYYTLLLADLVGSKGRVLAFEPNFIANYILRDNLDLNGFLHRVQVEQLAAWDVTAPSLSIKISRHHLGSSRVGGEDPYILGVPDRVRETRVDGTPIDDQPFSREPVAFVKIDAEGSELRIWRGMRQLWKNNPNLAVCMEYAKAMGGDALLTKLAADGARVQWIGPEGELCEDDPPDMSMLWVTHE